MQNSNIVNNTPIIIPGNTSIYTGVASESVNTTLIRNKNKCLLAILMGPGGGGSSGWADVAGANTTPGGGGGGAGAYVVNFIPSYLLPEVIEVRVDAGGAGGAASRLASNAGSFGGSTGLFTIKKLNSQNTLCEAFSGAGGTAATTSAGGGGGAIGSVGLNCMGIKRTATITGVGAAGGTTGTGTTTRANNDMPVSGGSGGGGITTTNIASAGGTIFNAGLAPAYTGVAGPTAVGVTPSFLFNRDMPNLSSGGLGGGSSSAAAGADGAVGNYGSGGGGGGASNSAASNSGAGGTGGPGLAIIVEI